MQLSLDAFSFKTVSQRTCYVGMAVPKLAGSMKAAIQLLAFQIFYLQLLQNPFPKGLLAWRPTLRICRHDLPRLGASPLDGLNRLRCQIVDLKPKVFLIIRDYIKKIQTLINKDILQKHIVKRSYVRKTHHGIVS